MTGGFYKFDFFIKEWLDGTRCLSNAAKGVYINILSAMYGHGGPIPYDERYLCRLTDCATARSFRPLLSELIDNGKLKIINGHLVNDRVQKEIPRIKAKIDRSREGGKARSSRVPPEYEPNTTGTHAETQTKNEQNQNDSSCQSIKGEGSTVGKTSSYYSKNSKTSDQNSDDWGFDNHDNVVPLRGGGS